MQTDIAFIGVKAGSSSVYTVGGDLQEITLITIGKNSVIGTKTKERDGYESVILAGGGKVKDKSRSKSVVGQFKKIGIETQRAMKEFRLPPYFKSSDFVISSEFGVSKELVGLYVDVFGVSKGKGFAGSMKRWNFDGQCASHGNSVSHRVHGSTGCRTDPGKVIKNKKMAGHMGNENVAIQNLKIVDAMPEEGILVLRGNIPGAVNGILYIKGSVKKVGVPTEFFNGVKPAEAKKNKSENVE